MDFGFTIPTRGPLANPEAISTLARRGEELGFGFLAVSDHVIIPNSIRSLYPYSPTGEFGTDGSCMDQLSLLSYLAGITTRIKLLSSVMVLPHRNPLLAAKMLATVDVLSGGRLTVGCGVGWMREEFEVLETPPVRGARAGRRRIHPRIPGALDERLARVRRQARQVHGRDIRP